MVFPILQNRFFSDNLSLSISWHILFLFHLELSLTVPIVNTLAFLFTVLGEWWVEGKVISSGRLKFPILLLSGR